MRLGSERFLTMDEQKRTGRALSWDDMRFFLILARMGQLTETARQLGTSHVTVSRRIDRLEEALDQRLFARSPKGYELTPAGRKMIEIAERMEAAAEGLSDGRSDGEAGLSGTFRLAVPEAFGAWFSDNLLTGFRKRFPRVTLELVTMTQVVSLSRREADLSVTVDPVDKGPFQSTKLVDYELRIYASKRYLALNAPVSSRQDLLGHSFIGYIEGMIFSPGLDYLDEVHPSLRPAIKGSSIYNQLSAARNGLGLCVLPNYVADRFADLVPVLPEEVRIHRGYWLTGHRDVALMRRERMIARFMADELETRRGDFMPTSPVSRG